MTEILVPISALYTALQALIAIGLTIPVGQARLRAEVSLGDGGNADLQTAIRRHANWTEHVPIALLLIALLELNGASAALLHGLGATLVVARIAHPIGLSATNMRSPLRGIGAFATMIVTAVAALALLWTAF